MINRGNLTAIMSPQATYGVLTDAEVLVIETVQGKRVLRSLLLPLDTHTLGGLLTYLWQQTELTAVWVMPGTTLSRTVTPSAFTQLERSWTAVIHTRPQEPTDLCSVLLWPRESNSPGTRRLALAFPEHAGWGNDWQVTDATALLATVTYLDQLLARPILDAPELVAHQLLTELTADQFTSQIRSHPVDLPTLHDHDGQPVPLPLEPAGPALARQFSWVRPLTLTEQRQRYLHSYRHCSLELEACLDVQLGAGAPQHSPGGRAFDGIRPGLWRISAEPAGSIFDGKRLPSCLEGEWMSTPQVACCRDIGYQVQAHEGYYWPEGHALLKRWATTLWQASERLRTASQRYRHAQGRANAARTLTTLARLGVAVLPREQAAGGWSRPDWWQQVLGRSRAALFAHLVRLARQGTMPALVVGDALWVVSDDPNPLTAVPGLLTSSRRWSGYTVGYEVPLLLSRDVREIFRNATHADQVATALDRLAQEVFP